MALLAMPDFTVDSSMPSGIKVKFIVQATDSKITLRSSADDSTAYPFTHPFMRVSTNGSGIYIYGVERVYNITTNRDVTEFIDTVSDESYIKFLPSYVNDGDNIEVTMYATFNEVIDGDKVSLEWIEQIYRHASSLDRTDFGNYTPPIEYHLDNSIYSNTKYTYQPRLFFACCGYPKDKEGFNNMIDGGDVITSGGTTVISWGPNNPSNRGVFVGDQAIANTKGGNANFTVAPIPFYISKIFMVSKLKTAEFLADKCPAILLDITIDGNNSAVLSGPNYTNESEQRLMTMCFGTDSKLILPFSPDFEYAGTSPAYVTGDVFVTESGGSTYEKYYCHEVKLGIIRASSLKITAKVVGERTDTTEDNLTKVNEWYLCVAGWIPKCY